MSSSVAKPIIKQIKDRQDALDFFEHVSLPKEDEKTQEIIMNFPTVYIHNWQESGDFEVYVGESNDIFKRTRQHYDAASDNSKWQSKLLEKDASLFIIGHEHFNKSLTLDIENRLMHYMMSVDRVKHVHNLRDNPQTSYYPMEELDEIFSRIWRGLRKENKELFPTESVIKDSAIYKASPLHKLTKKQEKARELIIQKVSDALENGEKKQLIFIDGEAGTGKTVLNSSTFYELYCQAEENNKEIKCHLLVNHDEQITVYEQIAEKLGLTEKYGKVVSKPTTFINNHSEGEERIKRTCAIVTDEDIQIVETDSKLYKAEAEKRGKSRKKKLADLYGTNPWVESFFAPHTLEVDFALADARANSDYISEVVELNYVDTNTIKRHKENLKQGTDAACANTVLTLARDMGKGWYATTLSNYIDIAVTVPQYILGEIAFASKEVISIDIVFKMIEYSLSGYDEKEVLALKKESEKVKTQEERKEFIKKFRERYKDDVVAKFLEEVDKYCRGWCE